MFVLCFFVLLYSVSLYLISTYRYETVLPRVSMQWTCRFWYPRSGCTWPVPRMSCSSTLHVSQGPRRYVYTSPHRSHGDISVKAGHWAPPLMRSGGTTSSRVRVLFTMRQLSQLECAQSENAVTIQSWGHLRSHVSTVSGLGRNSSHTLSLSTLPDSRHTHVTFR